MSAANGQIVKVKGRDRLHTSPVKVNRIPGNYKGTRAGRERTRDTDGSAVHLGHGVNAVSVADVQIVKVEGRNRLHSLR